VSERVFIFFLFICGAVYLYFGLKIEVPFAYEPLGPRAFPVLLGGSLLALCLLTLFFHNMSAIRLQKRVVRHGGAIFFYLLTFQMLGFMLATTVSTYFIARSVGCSWMQGLLTGLVLAISFYGIFHFLLGVPLPLGVLFRLGS
jgi:putative tricarboxylic transport membrane protein